MRKKSTVQDPSSPRQGSDGADDTVSEAKSAVMSEAKSQVTAVTGVTGVSARRISLMKSMKARTDWSLATESDLPRLGPRLAQIVMHITNTSKCLTRRQDFAMECLKLKLDMTHIVGIRVAITNTIKDMVGEGTWESEPDVAEAWMWLLDQICHEVATIINQVHKHAPVIHKSWQLVQDAVDMEQLGIIFYDFLFQTAPAMQSLFVKPKHLLGQMFGKMVGLLSDSVENPLRLTKELRELAIRHIKWR